MNDAIFRTIKLAIERGEIDGARELFDAALDRAKSAGKVEGVKSLEKAFNEPCGMCGGKGNQHSLACPKLHGIESYAELAEKLEQARKEA